MKRAGMPAIVLLTGLALTGCGFTEHREWPVEMVAFGSLSKAEQDLIPASPEDATVEKTAVSGEIRRFLVRDVEKIRSAP